MSSEVSKDTDEAKMETGENPVRSRHCNAGELLRCHCIFYIYEKASSLLIAEPGDIHKFNNNNAEDA